MDRKKNIIPRILLTIMLILFLLNCCFWGLNLLGYILDSETDNDASPLTRKIVNGEMVYEIKKGREPKKIER